jgi:tricarballylate dehydrogenase
MGRVTNYRADPDLVEVIVNESYETITWLKDLGIRFIPWPGWHGMPLQVSGGGAGLVEGLTEAAQRAGIEVSYDCCARELLREHGRIVGASVDQNDEQVEFRAQSVILATGGFQASAEWRARYLGPEWDLVPVRGTWTNTGDGLRMALDAGAQSFGHWSKAHAAGWDLNAPPFGDPRMGDLFKKHCFDLGIIVNARGQRFFDEGSDFRAFSYTKYAPEILRQPGAFAWQIFDAKVTPLLSDEYRIRRATRVRGDSIEELAKNLDGVDAQGFLRTVEEFNAAVDDSKPFDQRILDGRGTEGLTPPKSNWAQTISEPPYEAYAITCGITFTYGGIKIDPSGFVLATDGKRIPGLFAAGEMIGGIFYYNYAAGAALTSGSVFGKIAGRSAVHDA